MSSTDLTRTANAMAINNDSRHVSNHRRKKTRKALKLSGLYSFAIGVSCRNTRIITCNLAECNDS